MVDEAISIEPQDSAALREVDRVLRRGAAKLVGPKGEHAMLRSRSIFGARCLRAGTDADGRHALAIGGTASPS